MIPSKCDLYEGLRQYALFVASEKEKGVGQGGSLRSQFHRKKVDQTNPDFETIAVREYDALAEMADQNDKPMEEFVLGLTRTGVEAFKGNVTVRK